MCFSALVELQALTRVTVISSGDWSQLEHDTTIRGGNQGFEKLIYTFISRRLDYYNSLFFGLLKKKVRHLQLIQKAAARVLRKTQTSEEITAVLRSLHWLPVCQTTEQFKILLLVYK